VAKLLSGGTPGATGSVAGRCLVAPTFLSVIGRCTRRPKFARVNEICVDEYIAASQVPARRDATEYPEDFSN
jgi:hypothetical protein